jgi:hypothetical protein
MVCVETAPDSGKHQAWPPTDHFQWLIEEACPNHVYPIKHKLRDCGMMNNFMVSGSLTRGMELDEVLDEDNTTPFPREHHVSNMSPRTPNTLRQRARGCRDVSTQVFQYLYIIMCIGI